LIDNKTLQFSYEEHKWKWDFIGYDINEISESVTELLKAKILKLDSATQNVLKVASCIGDHFLLSTLMLLTDDSDAIDRAISEGWIVPSDGNDASHRFAHD